MNGYDALGLFLDQIEIARTFWRLTAMTYMLTRGYLISAMFLEHSLHFFPSDLSYEHGSYVASKIRGSKKYQAEVDRFLRVAPYGRRDYSDIAGERLELDDNLDLKYAFDHVGVRYDGWTCRRSDGRLSARLTVTIKDRYDFDWKPFSDEKHPFGEKSAEDILVLLGNNAAFLNQYLLVINNYNVKVSINEKR